MANCEHNKIYSNCVLMSNPPIFRWICDRCGEEGQEIQRFVTSNYSYEELIKTKKKKQLIDFNRVIAQIRKIRDTFGDDKCVFDWHELFRMLPEGYKPPEKDIEVQLTDCKRYLTCKAEGTEYIPPPRWIVGPPDKIGLWICDYANFKKIVQYQNDSILYGNVVRSFGPMPE